ncbi:hypothetical protein N2152v2_010438 [Parachlorella kessleri]
MGTSGGKGGMDTDRFEGRSHSHSHSQGSVAGHGHDHSEHEHSDPSNPVHRALKWLFDTTRLSSLAEWLEQSTAATAAKIGGIFVAAVAAWLAGRLAADAAATAQQVSTAATWAVYCLAGVPALVDLAYDLTAGRIDTHVLMTLAAVGTLLSGYAIEGALLLVLFQTSHTLEHLLTHRAQGNLAELYDTIPTSAVLVQVGGPGGAPELGSARQVTAGEVAVGNHMLVKPGEQVPLDGTITFGKALVSAEHITGESLPVLRRPGDEIAAGSLNRDGLLVVKATRLAEESTPARIAKLTLDAQATRPRLRTWLDQFGEVYSKGVILASLAVLGVLLAMGVPLLGSGAERGAFYRAMGLLTVASPCALVMVPLAYVSAIAAIASRGILVKGGRVLDALSSCRTVAFDKTGTLTTGSLVCSALLPLQAKGPPAGSAAGGSSSSSGNNGSSSSGSGGLQHVQQQAGRQQALRAAMALSQRSTHPVSEAVVLMGEREGLDSGSCHVSDFRLVAGGGVEGTVSGGSGSWSGSSSSEGSKPPSSNANGSNEMASSSSGGVAQGGAGHHCWFGAVDYVEARLTVEERTAVQRLMSAPGQASTSVLSVLVMEPAEVVADGASSNGGGSGNGGMKSAESSPAASSVSGGHGHAGSASSSGSDSSSSSSTVVAGQRSVWLFRFEDSVRQQSADAVAALQQGSWAGATPSLLQSVQVLMLTGDHPASAERIARKLGIGRVHAALTPEQKLAKVTALKEQQGPGGGVIMVGDGINDAPALATADVGIAIASTATAAASAAADAIVLNSSGIAAVPFLLMVARDTQAVIRQNLALAAASIIALVIPTVLGAVPLWLAVFIHEGSTLLVALNSLRPLRHAARFAGVAGLAASSSGSELQREAGSAVDGSDRQGLGPGEESLGRAAAVVTSPAV